MLVIDQIKIQGPCSLNRPTNSTDDIFKFIQGSQHDNEIKVVVNANQEVNIYTRFINYNHIPMSRYNTIHVHKT